MSYTVVLKTHGPFPHVFGYETISNFAVLHDSASHSQRFNMPFCTWNFRMFEVAYPQLHKAYRDLPSDRKYFKNEAWYASHYEVMAPVMLFVTGMLTGSCNTVRSKERPLWVLESDAVFGGNPQTFFDDMNAVQCDLLSTGYAAADARWWGFAMHTPLQNLFAPKVHDRPSFDCVHRRLVETCTAESCNFNRAAVSCPRQQYGFLFRLVIVERFSPRLLRMLDEAFRRGVAITGEAMASSLCDAHRNCVIKDWQHELSNHYLSRHYVWSPRPRGEKFVAPRDDKLWIHPMKLRHLFAARLFI